MSSSNSPLARSIRTLFVDVAPELFDDAGSLGYLQTAVRIAVETHEFLGGPSLADCAADELEYHCDTIRSGLDSLYHLRIMHRILRDTTRRDPSWSLPEDDRALEERYEAGFADLQRDDISLQQRPALLLELGKLQLLLLAVAF